MESAENREQPQPAYQQTGKSSNPPSLSTTETFQLLNDSLNRLELSIKRMSNHSATDLPFSNANNTFQKNFSLVALGVTAIAIVVATVFWLWLPQRQVSFFSMPEAAATEIMLDEEITTNPEPTETSTISSDNSININTVTKEQPVAIESANPELETADETAIPQDLVSPGKSKKLNLETIEPKLTFTPEQTLIAALQTRVVELTKDYTEKFVNSIEVDLPKSSLSVEVKDNWYELKDSLQNKLANDILKRSRKFHFDKLELKDSQGTLVARNPVVGDQIIILQSHKSNKKPATDD
ncbi:hypothetical protein [Pleurocapsa sp. PCC 7319]|uniref:hypothetical protein n=1 Tax=Pleurocapsa sp. PCC 7319 TaxID=118161 RepID=UPI000344D773|nr:hypothetical protein [Pleurocapsa sp. PCC 7319]